MQRQSRAAGRQIAIFARTDYGDPNGNEASVCLKMNKRPGRSKSTPAWARNIRAYTGHEFLYVDPWG